MINVVCTSKPCDGLLYYSYEYSSYLNSIGVTAQLIIITDPEFSNQDYINTINEKFIHCKNIIFNDYFPENDITLIMGRSMLTLPFMHLNKYTEEQLFTLHLLFINKLISVYSSNHPIKYYDALEYFKPEEVIDLCDTDIYLKGEGSFFMKGINFSIHKPIVEDIQFEYLFNGTNEAYYNVIKKYILKYQSHGIITYDHNYLDQSLNNIQAPVYNMLGIFDTYVYTKTQFDPAPRITQECEYHGKKVIYLTNKKYIDGEEVYRNRVFVDIKDSIEPILKAIDELI